MYKEQIVITLKNPHIELFKFENVIHSQWHQTVSTSATAQVPCHHISPEEHQHWNPQQSYLHHRKSAAKIAAPSLLSRSLDQMQVSAASSPRTYLHLPPSAACAVLQLWAMRTSGQGSMAQGKSYSRRSRKTLEWAAERGTKQRNIWLKNSPGYYSLRWTYCREGGLEIMQEMLSCSWSEEISGLISFPDTSVISAMHHWVPISSLSQPKQEQWGGGCGEAAGDLGLTSFMAAWPGKVNLAASLLRLGKSPPGAEVGKKNLPKVGKKNVKFQ